MPEARACPVCAEPLGDAPERCFRCETPLAAWWPFEKGLDEALAEPGAAVVARLAVFGDVARPGARRGYGPLLAAVALGLVAGLLAGLAVFKAPVALPANPTLSTQPPVATASPVPTPSAAAGAIVSYRVQPGDSLWRIAAAMTGDGRCWRQLWPERADQLLRPGTVLEVSARSATAPGDRPSCTP